MRKGFLAALLGVALVGLSDVQVRADHEGGHGYLGSYGYGHFGYYGQYRSLYGLGRLPVPPYYALHPPVYYSRPVARSYGLSPFACPCQHVEAEEIQGEVIENPHFKHELKGADGETTSQQTARVILNPFFRGDAQLVSVPE